MGNPTPFLLSRAVGGAGALVLGGTIQGLVARGAAFPRACAARRLLPGWVSRRFGGPAARSHRREEDLPSRERPRIRCAWRPFPEALEVRIAPSIAGLAGGGADGIPAVVMHPILQEDAAAIGAPTMSAAGGPTGLPVAWSLPTPWGCSPRQIRTAYGIDGIAFGAITGDGAGQTIAIIDAYDDPSLRDSSDPHFSSSDLARFDRQYGLPDPPSFLKLNEYGSPTDLPGTDPAGAGTPGNWEEEEALDVEWAHALAPGAEIILVESQANTGDDLYQSARMAAGLPGVSVVTMSWGCDEYSGQESDDGSFTTPVGHQGVTFLAASGDKGSPGLYPAYSPNVVAVGGTSLSLVGDQSYGGETAWSGSGGGTSTSEAEPAYQEGVQGTGKRTVPDVAFDADPTTGVSVYDSYNDTHGDGPWKKIGGTSLAAPCWAALIAIADQGRVIRGGATLDGAHQTLPALYALPGADFHDITDGSNVGFRAGPGYDEVTGLGSPAADILVPDLASFDISPRLTVIAGPPTSVTAGDPFRLAVQAEDPDGSVDRNFSGRVTVALADNPGGAILWGRLTVTAHDGIATFPDLTLTRAAGGYRLRAITDGLVTATTIAFDATPAAPARLVITSPAPAVAPGGPFELMVSVADCFGNVVTTYSVRVTLAAAGRSGRGALRGTLTATVTRGIATSSRSRVMEPGRGTVLKASARGLIAATVTLTDLKSTGAKSLEEQARLIRAEAKPAGLLARRAARLAVRRALDVPPELE